jgi:hypothetical protein
MKLEKHTVCASCQAVGVTDTNCICVDNNRYPTIELEFEVCKCCGNLISDGEPADTEFNNKQLK